MLGVNAFDRWKQPHRHRGHASHHSPRRPPEWYIFRTTYLLIPAETAHYRRQGGAA
ncbi:hypothetical protein NDQ72_01120 [Halomonas sp. KG2]|uniref:hypothetical protein n=1 Tax=Halomonas sp. KG2 TaxID=2951138 RepID=UPI0026497900|nr:hypothetical protein [Halomonas sp. KG2]WKD28576.1 hypothetical protein NDQ72_01120 [Halomonas sp. KG2]